MTQQLAQGRVVGNFFQDGQTHLGGAVNSVTNPAVDTVPNAALTYFSMFGVPPKVDPNNADILGHESHTIAELYDKVEPTMMKNYVIRDVLQNEEFQHFVVCPPIDSSTNMEGVGTHVLRFGTSPLSPQPEGSSGTLIKHRFERNKVKLERYGQSFELHDDFALLPQGAQLYQEYLNMMNHDMAFSGMMAVMTALLHCYDPKREFVARYGGSSALGRYQNLDTMNRLFGAAHKRQLALRHLQNHANQVARAQSANGQFTHVFVTEKTATQFIFGDPFEYNYSSHGPGNLRGIDGGTAALTRMQSGTIIVKERDYILDGTTMQPGERLQMLEQHVSTGRYNVMLLDNTVLTTSTPDPREDMGLGYLDMNTGNGQIKVQDMVTLVRHLLCWDTSGALRRDVYEHLASGKNAEILAQRLGMGSDALRIADGSSLIDTFIVDEVGQNRMIVQIVGNMHAAYLGPEAQSTIARMAAEAVSKLVTAEDMRLMNVAIRFSEESKSASPSSVYSVAFADSLLRDEENPRVRRQYNLHGVLGVPPFGDLNAAVRRFLGGNATVGAATVAINRGLFPGFSSIKHLRTVRDFVDRKDGAWYAALTLENQRLLAEVAAGVTALEKFARACKLIWSVPTAPNTFFRASSLPFWNRSQNAKDDELDAFIQNIVLGIGYPTGLVVGANNNEVANDAGLLAGDRAPLRFVIPIGTADAEEKILVMPIINAFLATLGLDPVDYGTDAERRALLDRLYKENAFGDSGNKIFPIDFLGVTRNAAAVAAAAGMNADTFARASLARLFAGLRVEDANGAAATGLDAVTDILKTRISIVGDDQAARENLVDGRVRGFVAVLTKFEQARDDANVAGNAAGTVLLEDTVVRRAAWYGSMMARGGGAGKRKLVRTGDDDATERARATALAAQGGVFRDVRGAPRIWNTQLVFSAVRWREVYTAGIPAAGVPDRYLVATDPSNPVNAWMPLDNGIINAAPLTNQFHAMAAREKFHIDDTCMGKISGAAFVQPAAEGSAPKRARTSMPDEDFGGRVSGARYVDMPQRRDPFASVPRNLANELRDDAMDVDGFTTMPFGARRAAPHRVAAGTAVAQDANKYFAWRWEGAITQHASNIVLLAQHLLLLGARVHRDSFVNMIENGVPPPVGVVTVDPFIEFSMTHAVFAVAGCGNLYYGFPSLSMSYDAVHKKLHAYLTVWLKASVHLPQNVYIAENIAFNGYLGGGNGSLVRSVYSETDTMPPEDDYDYYPSDPRSRRANRFALHVGVNTKLADLPNPLPLTGTFGGRGAYHGVGRYVNPTDDADQGMLYDSALVTNLICQFDKLNRNTSVDHLASAETFIARSDMVAGSYNTLCYLADQWMRNRSTGAQDVHKIVGTGPMGELCPGVMEIMSGDVPGLIENKLALCVK